MSIRDFHSKLVSPQFDNALFRALRKLSQTEDAKSLFARTTDESSTWGEWAASSSLAS